MKTIKSTETYKILEQDETGLIPKGIGSVIVHYEEDGEINLYYGPIVKKMDIDSPEEDIIEEHNVYDLESQRLNFLKPTTQKGIEKVVQFLEESSR